MLLERLLKNGHLTWDWDALCPSCWALDMVKSGVLKTTTSM